MNKPTEEKLREMLSGSGLRSTAHRGGILTVLLSAERPLTQEQIAEKLGVNAPNKTTIYRTLVVLLKHNLVHRAYVQNRTWHFEAAYRCRSDQCHPHFTCVRCQRIHCLHEAFIPAVENVPEGFTVQSRQLRLQGICADCQKKTVTA